jgi:hypothetical protein
MHIIIIIIKTKENNYYNCRIRTLKASKKNPENFHYYELQTPDGQSVLEIKKIHRTVMMSDY